MKKQRKYLIRSLSVAFASLLAGVFLVNTNVSAAIPTEYL